MTWHHFRQRPEHLQSSCVYEATKAVGGFHCSFQLEIRFDPDSDFRVSAFSLPLFSVVLR